MKNVKILNKKTIKSGLRRSILNLPQKDKIKKISLFGSYLSKSAQKDSDIDLLIEFAAPATYFDLVEIQEKFKQALGKKIDLVTPAACSPYIRQEIIKQAEAIYEK